MIKEEKIENFKSRDLINVECDCCGNSIQRKKHHALAYEKHYCNNACKGSHKKEEYKKLVLEKGHKECNKCKEEKKLEEFNKKKNNADGLQSFCRECQNHHAKEYYEINNEKQKNQIRISTKIRIKDNREKYFNILSSSSCIVCGETNPVVLEFDHKDGVDKIKGVGYMVGNGYSWTAILKEIKKCDVRCANCHRIRTAEQFGWYKGL